MEIMLNCENPVTVAKYLEMYDMIDGVTVNPIMVSKRGNCDFKSIIRDLRDAAGTKKVFAQVTSPVYEEMLKEAEIIREAGGENTYVKIPANEIGIQAIRTLSNQGMDVIATLAFSTLQCVMCLKAGAKYVVPFYAYMLEAGLDADAVVKEAANYAHSGEVQGKIMVAGCRKMEQFGHVIALGADAVTLNPEFITNAMMNDASVRTFNNFMGGWYKVRGEGNTIYKMYHCD